MTALEKPPREQEQFLEGLRQRDPELHERVRRLLSAHNRTGLLDESAPAAARGGSEPSGSNPNLTFRAGHIIGDYEILGEVGAGGAGVVYKARQTSLDRVVALKFLRVGEFATPREIQRFQAEAGAAARLDHPHIVPVFETGQIDGRHYFSMKLIEGPSLSSRIEHFKSDPRRAVELLHKVSLAVHHAHQRGLLHRDLKPSNILLDESGEPYVADFGIAKQMDPDEHVTESGWLCGTPSYMAPEQVSRQCGEVTVETDIYALGCILYELLTGAPPFQGATIPDTFRKILQEEPASLRLKNDSVSRDLETICLKCLSKEAHRRYQSAYDLAQELERWLDHRPIEARRASLAERLWLMWRRKPVVTTLASTIILLTLVLALGATLASLLLRQNLERALQAEKDAGQKLRQSLLAQARANRRSGLPGQRLASLDLLTQSAAIQPGSDLRDEAIAALALTDLEKIEEQPLPQEGSILAFDRTLQRYVHRYPAGRLVIRNAQGGAELSLPGFGPEAWVVRFSRDNRYLAVKYHLEAGVDQDAALRIWDLSTGKAVLSADTAIAQSCMDFSRSADALALCSPQGRLRLLDVDSGQDRWSRSLSKRPSLVRFNPEGSLLAVALPGKIELRTGTGRLLNSIAGPWHCWDLDWSPDGELLAAAGADTKVHLWSVRGSDARPLRVLEGHQAEVIRVLFSPQAPLLATYSWDGTSRLWDSRTGRQLLMSTAAAAGFSGDGRLLALTTSSTRSLWRVWHDDALRTLHGHQGRNPTGVAVSLDGRLLASYGSDGVLLWDAASGQVILRLSGEETGGLEFDPVGGSLITCSRQGLLRWALPSAQQPPDSVRPELITSDPCRRVAVSRQGTTLAYFSLRGEAKVLDLQDPREPRMLPAFPGMEWPSVSPLGQRIAAGNWRGDRVQVWNSRSGLVEAVLKLGTGSMRADFSPDGRSLVTGDPHEYAIWEAGSWRKVRTIQRPAKQLNSSGLMAFSPDSRLLAVALTRREIQLVEVETGLVLATLQAPEPQTLSEICFSPTQARLVTAARTNRIMIWELDHIFGTLDGLRLDQGLSGRWRDGSVKPPAPIQE